MPMGMPMQQQQQPMMVPMAQPMAVGVPMAMPMAQPVAYVAAGSTVPPTGYVMAGQPGMVMMSSQPVGSTVIVERSYGDGFYHGHHHHHHGHGMAVGIGAGLAGAAIGGMMFGGKVSGQAFLK